MVECGGLENHWAERFRGFESPSLLHAFRLADALWDFSYQETNLRIFFAVAMNVVPMPRKLSMLAKMSTGLAWMPVRESIGWPDIRKNLAARRFR